MNNKIFLAFCLSGTLSIDDYTNKVLENNHLLNSKKSEIEANLTREKINYAKKLPEIKFETSAKAFTHKNEIEMPNPIRPSQTTIIEMGDTKTLSAGVSLNHTLYDGGYAKNALEASEVETKANTIEKSLLETDVKANSRRQFLSFYYTKQKLKLIEDSIALSVIRNKDIEKKYKLGALSKLDYLYSNKELLNYKLELEKAKEQLNSEKINFIGLLNCKTDNGADTDIDKLELIQANSLSTRLNSKPKTQISEHKQIKLLDERSNSLAKTAESMKSLLYPQIFVQAKSSYEYPDNNKKEFFQNNLIGLNISIPIFEFSKTQNTAKEIRLKAESLSERAKEEQRKIQNEYDVLIKNIESIKNEISILTLTINEEDKIATIQNDLYKQGKVQYIDVQNANQKLLETKISKNDFELKLKITEVKLLTFYENLEEQSHE